MPQEAAAQQQFFKSSALYQHVHAGRLHVARVFAELTSKLAPIYSYLCQSDAMVKNHPIELLGNYLGSVPTSFQVPLRPAPVRIQPANEYLFETHHINDLAAEIILRFIFLIGLLVDWAYKYAPYLVAELNAFYREWICREMLRKMTWFDVEDKLGIKQDSKPLLATFFAEPQSLDEMNQLQRKINFLFLKASLKLIEPSQAMLIVHRELRKFRIKGSLQGFLTQFFIPGMLIGGIDLLELESMYCISSIVKMHPIHALIEYVNTKALPESELPHKFEEYFSLFQRIYDYYKKLLKTNREVGRGFMKVLDADTEKANKHREGILYQIAAHYLAIQQRKIQLQVNDDARSLFFYALMTLEIKLAIPLETRQLGLLDDNYYEVFKRRLLFCLNEDVIDVEKRLAQVFIAISWGERVSAIYRALSFCLMILDPNWNQAKWQLATHLIPRDWQEMLLRYLEDGRLHNPGFFSSIGWDDKYSDYIKFCCQVFRSYSTDQGGEMRAAASALPIGIQFRQFNMRAIFCGEGLRDAESVLARPVSDSAESRV
jgi:hypothetical protein